MLSACFLAVALLNFSIRKWLDNSTALVTKIQNNIESLESQCSQQNVHHELLPQIHELLPQLKETHGLLMEYENCLKYLEMEAGSLNTEK